MAAGGKFKQTFFGFDDLAKKLQTLSSDDEIGKILRPAVRSAMNDAKKRAAGLIPQGIDPHRTYKGRLVAPGFARRSLRVISKLDKTKHKASAVLGVRAEAFYAVQFVELGTSKMPARPWLRPAFAASTDPAVRMVGEGLKQWIVDLAGRHMKAGRSARAATLLAGLQ